MLSKIASSCDEPSVFGKNGDVRAILKNVFSITPITECLTVIIPLLAGVSGNSANLAVRPYILPIDTEHDVDRKLWMGNWGHIISITTGRCPLFSRCLVEQLALRTAQETRAEDRAWLCELLKHLFSLTYFKLLIHNETNKKENRLCTEEELKTMNCDYSHIMSQLLRSPYSDVMDCLTTYFQPRREGI